MYAMSYFRTEAEALHLAVSDDGLDWQALNGNQPVWESTVGSRSVRDPFIFPARDGRFHLLSTNGWQADSILHAASEDLLHWTDAKLVPIMQGVPNVRNCWAPECFYDQEEDLYRLIWSSSVTDPTHEADWNHRIWSATTRDWKTFTPATLFFDPDHSVIDATVVRHGSRYLMAFKDERGENKHGTDWKAIRVCFSDHGGGPWTEVSDLLTPSLTEGPTLFWRDGAWTMFFDHFIENHFGAAQSRDGLRWEDITARVTFPPDPRHAAVFEIPDELGQRLRSALG